MRGSHTALSERDRPQLQPAAAGSAAARLFLRMCCVGEDWRRSWLAAAGWLKRMQLDMRTTRSLDRDPRRFLSSWQGSQGSKAVTEWADLATASADDYVPEDDPVYQKDINRLCNVGLKAMLRDESREVRSFALCSPLLLHPEVSGIYKSV